MKEIACLYKEESYSVRDDGSVLRHAPATRRPRKLDNEWTFGKKNLKTGYMEIASVSVHKIVATAFYGASPGKDYVVDHKDTNKCNNRPENLRWVTKLENIILNPTTAKRISIVCGSVEAFLADPAAFKDKFPDPKFDWMRTVTADEAKRSYERLLSWAESEVIPSSGSVDKWILGRNQQVKVVTDPIQKVSDTIASKTPSAWQRHWRTPSEFPCCPTGENTTPLVRYAERLIAGEVFCRNELYSSLVHKSVIANEGKSIMVITENEDSVKPWGLAEITYEGDLFMHTSLGTFFTQDGVEKQYCLAQGLEWTGKESIDDYC